MLLLDHPTSGLIKTADHLINRFHASNPRRTDSRHDTAVFPKQLVWNGAESSSARPMIQRVAAGEFRGILERLAKGKPQPPLMDFAVSHPRRPGAHHAHTASHRHREPIHQVHGHCHGPPSSFRCSLRPSASCISIRSKPCGTNSSSSAQPELSMGNRYTLRSNDHLQPS